MFVIGAILIVLAIIVVIYVTFATRNFDPLQIDWGPFTAALTPLQLFFVGAVSILVLAIGAAMFSIGLKSQGAKRAEVKQLRKDVKAGQADNPDSNVDTSKDPKKAKDRRQVSAESSSSSRNDTRGGSGGTRIDRDRTAHGPSAGESLDDGAETRANPASVESTGPRLPPPVPPRDNTPPPPRTTDRS